MMFLFLFYKMVISNQSVMLRLACLVVHFIMAMIVCDRVVYLADDIAHARALHNINQVSLISLKVTADFNILHSCTKVDSLNGL